MGPNTVYIIVAAGALVASLAVYIVYSLIKGPKVS